MSDVISDLLALILVFTITSFLVVRLGELTSDIRKTNVTKQRFTEACNKAGGNIVWNGKHWECLPMKEQQ